MYLTTKAALHKATMVTILWVKSTVKLLKSEDYQEYKTAIGELTI